MIKKKNNNLLSPAQVCELFGISKSTLLRWEKAGFIPSAKRDDLNQRLYTQEDVREIAQQTKHQITNQFERIGSTKSEEDAEKAFENLYVLKFIRDEPDVLTELNYFPKLSADSIRKLCRIGLERYEPWSKEFIQLAKIIAQKGEKLAETIER